MNVWTGPRAMNRKWTGLIDHAFFFFNHVDGWVHLCRLLGAVWCSAKKNKKTMVSWPFFGNLTFKHKLNIVADQVHPLYNRFPFQWGNAPYHSADVFRNGLWNMTKSSKRWLDRLNFPDFHPWKLTELQRSAANIQISDLSAHVQKSCGVPWLEGSELFRRHQGDFHNVKWCWRINFFFSAYL